MADNYIVHAAQPEVAGVNGKPGDQTGNEVCIGTWYNKDWKYVLRLNDEQLRLRAVRVAVELANNPCVGYSQGGTVDRNSLIQELRKLAYKYEKLVKECNCDCSSFICAVLETIGIKIDYSSNGNAPTTSTMVNTLMKTNLFTKFTSKEYLTSYSKLLPGDIVVRPAGHTFMFIGDYKRLLNNKEIAIFTVGSSVYEVVAVTADSVSGTRLGTQYIVTEDLNLREGAGTDSKVLKVLKKGETVYIRQSLGTWGQVVIITPYGAAEVGWCSKKYLKVIKL